MEDYKFKIYKFLKAYIKLEKIIKFGDIETEKQTFHQHKKPISIKNIDINEMVVSNEFCFGKIDLNILLATKTLKNIRSLDIFLPKMAAYRKDFVMKLNICIF